MRDSDGGRALEWAMDAFIHSCRFPHQNKRLGPDLIRVGSCHAELILSELGPCCRGPDFIGVELGLVFPPRI